MPKQHLLFQGTIEMKWGNSGSLKLFDLVRCNFGTLMYVFTQVDHKLLRVGTIPQVPQQGQQLPDLGAIFVILKLRPVT